VCGTEGNRLAQTDVDEDESRDYEKACLAEGKREPKARGGAYAGNSTTVAVRARRGAGPLGESLPDKDTQCRKVTECEPDVTLVCWRECAGTRAAKM